MKICPQTKKVCQNMTKVFSKFFPQQFGIFFPNITENLQQNIPFFGSLENSPPQKKKNEVWVVVHL
jgi:hypothetical protein